MTGATLSVTEAAEYLAKTEQWVSREASAGRLPSLKLGRDRRFLKARLDEWIEAQAFTAADPLAQTTASRSRRRRTA